MIRPAQLAVLVVAVLAVSACDAPARDNQAAPQPAKTQAPQPVNTQAPPLPIPTDGTWSEKSSNSLAGFGQWSDYSGTPWDVMINTPPVVTQNDRGYLVIESQVHIRRNRESRWPLGEPHASLVPGVSILGDNGQLNYDEAYGEAKATCPVDDLAVGEETVCTISYEERYHPEWLQDSYWHVEGVRVAAWPSQTTPPGEPE